MYENFTLVLTPTYDTCMKEFCKVSPASRANDASRDDGDYQIVAKLVVAFFTELFFLLSSSKPLEERHKKNPFWFIGVYTEMTAGLEKLIVCF